MFLKITEITLPTFLIALVGFFYSRRFKPDLGGANKLVVDIALPVLIFVSLAAKSFDPMPAAVFNFMFADKFQVGPNKVASTVIVGHVCSLAFLPLGIWLAFM